MKKVVLINSLFTLVMIAALFGPRVAMAADCPAFTTEMVDAAAMAFSLYPGIDVDTVEDNPSVPSISCILREEGAGARFVVDVNSSGDGDVHVQGIGRMEDTPDYDTHLFSGADELSLTEISACRKLVLKSFVWKNYCAPAL